MSRPKLLLPEAAALRERFDGPGLIEVRVTPNASADEVILPIGDSTHLLIIRTTVTPEHGKANDAVLRLLAKALTCQYHRWRSCAGPRAGTSW